MDLPAVLAPFEAFRIEDSRLAAGYEATPPLVRAAVKSTLALLRQLWPELPERFEQRTFPATGCLLRSQSRPCPFVLLVLAPDFAAPTRLAAQIAALRLAGVEQAVLIRLTPPGAPPFPDALLACMELAGMDQGLEIPLTSVVAASPVPTLLTALHEAGSGKGRLLLFGTRPPEASSEAFPERVLAETGPKPEAETAWNEDSLFAPLLALATRLGLGTHRAVAPRIALALPPDEQALVRSLHPDAVFLLPEQGEQTTRCPGAEVLLSASENLVFPAPAQAPACQLGGTFARCWVPPLEPAFFHNPVLTLLPSSPPAEFEP